VVDLLPFPAQPDEVPWPTEVWPRAEVPSEARPAEVEAIVARLLGPDADPAVGHTNAVAVVHRGRLVVERYGEREITPLTELAGVEPGPITPEEPLGSWSMAKSLCHLGVGVAVAEGVVDPTAPVPVPEWEDPDDPRAAITWDDLLTMRPGLAWTEVYEGFDADGLPDVVAMLYGDGAADMAAFAAAKPLYHRPGTPAAFTYSSGTTNIVQRALQTVLGLDGDGALAWLRERVLSPVGVTSFAGDLDGAGTWVASSHARMTTPDWLRVGLLVLRGGAWDGVEVVPSPWIDHGRTPRSPHEDILHGAHWWARPDRADGTFMAHGFEGQRLMMVPARDLIVFRSGRTQSDGIPALNRHLLDLVDRFPTST